MIENNYNDFNTNSEYYQAELKLKENKSLRGRCISTGLLCIICYFTFSLLAVILNSIMASAYRGTPLLTDDSLSLIPDMLLNGVISLVGFGAVALIFCKVTRTDLNEILPGEKVPLKKLVGVVIIGFAISLSANYIAQIFSVDLGIFGLETTYTSSETGSTSWFEHIAYIITVAFVPAVTEEFVFRGCIMGRLKKFGDGFALFASALLFALMHGNLSQAPFALVVGLGLGWAVIYTGSVIPSMLIHFVNNFMSVIYDIVTENLSLMDIDTVYVDFVYTGIYCVVFALGLYCAYRFSKNDKSFCEFKKYEGQLSFKERIKTFFTSATIIIFLVISLLQCIINLKVK